MKTPPNTIIELPTDLWHSPFFDFYYNLGIGGEDNCLENMVTDLRNMYRLPKISELDRYLFLLRSAYRAGFVKATESNPEHTSSQMKLLGVCPYTDEPLEAVRWLLELTETVSGLRKRYIHTGAALRPLDQQFQGAMIVPFRPL